MLFLVVTTTMLVRRFACVRCPVPGPPRSESVVWLVPLPAAGFPVGRSEWFCGGHGPGETPGPFPNPEAKAWHGDGTALERVWESSAPPHSFVGGSRRASAPGTFFYSHGVFSSGRWGIYRRRPAGPREDSSSGWKERDAGRPVGWCFSPVDGGFRTVEGLWTYWLFQ